MNVKGKYKSTPPSKLKMKLRMLPYVLSGPREKLQGIFKHEQDALCEEGSEALKNALEILRKYPTLAVEYFDATDDEEHICFQFMPLSIFIASGANLQVIEQVYNFYPEAVSTPHPKLGIYPLQAACEVHADYDVLEFLAHKYPDAAKKRDHKGDLIIHSILSQGKDFIPRRKTVELLLDLYPGSLSKATNDGACPLGVAFRTGQSTKIVERIIEKRHEQSISSFYIGEWNEYKLDAKDASRLCCELFPKLRLKTFHCDPPSYSEGGFIGLMEAMSNDTLIEEFSVAFPKLDTNMSEAFLKVLRQNRTIRKLRLTRRDGMWSHDAGIDTLLQGTSLNASLQTLCLSGLFLMSSFEFAFLIAKGPKKLILEDIMVENQWRSANSTKWTGSSVKSLTIRNCKMSGKCLDKMLASLDQLPVLKDLSLDFTAPEDSHDAKHLNGRDITTPIIGLLKHNWLKSLKVQGLNMEMRHLSVELGTNTSLRVLHMDALRNTLSLNVQCLVAALIEDNKTLEEVKFHCDYKYDPDQGKTGQLKRSFEYVEDPAITFYTDRNQKENKKKPKGHHKEEKPKSLRHVQSCY